MKITTEELVLNGFEELERLNHKELVPFIQKYLKNRTWYSVLYYLSNIASFATICYLVTKDLKSPVYSLGNQLTNIANGMALAFALLPLHEYIHVLAYKSQGATKTSYYVNLKKFYFMAIADKFVANRKEFTIIALAPFLFITTSLVALFPFVNPSWELTIAGVLFTHTAMCSGDFGLLSFFAFHKAMDVVTYDDKENGLSLFYGKPR